MFTILLKCEYGWTTNLGSGENNWTTEAEAEEACAELCQVWDDPKFKIVATEDLGRYDLVA